VFFLLCFCTHHQNYNQHPNQILQKNKKRFKSPANAQPTRVKHTMSASESIDFLQGAPLVSPSTPPSSQPLPSAKLPSTPPPIQTQIRPPPALPLVESTSSSLQIFDSVDSSEEQPRPISKLNTILIAELPSDGEEDEDYSHDPKYQHYNDSYNQESPNPHKKKRVVTRVPITLKSILCTGHPKKRKPNRWVKFKGELLNDRIYKSNMISDVAVPADENAIFQANSAVTADNRANELKMCIDENDTDTDDDDYQPNGSDIEDEAELYQEELVQKNKHPLEESYESREDRPLSSHLEPKSNSNNNTIVDDLHRFQSSDLSGSLEQRVTFYLNNHDYDDAMNLAACVMNKNLEKEGIPFSMLLKDSEVGFSSLTTREALPRSLIPRHILGEGNVGTAAEQSSSRPRAEMRDEWRRRKLIYLRAEEQKYQQQDVTTESIIDHSQSQSQPQSQFQSQPRAQSQELYTLPPQLVFSSMQQQPQDSVSSGLHCSSESSVKFVLLGSISSTKKRQHDDLHPSAVTTTHTPTEPGPKKKRCLVPRRLSLKRRPECRDRPSQTDLFLR
jgi:hypothetical protein